MSGSGWKDWQIGEVVEATDFQSYVQDQVVQYYGTEAARGSAVGTATTGMVSYVDGQGLEYAVNDGLGERWENIQTGGRNYIINGAFDIWQRGTSFTTPPDARTADQWVHGTTAGTYALTQQTFTPGAAPVSGYEGRFYLRATTSSFSSGAIFDHANRVEDVRTLAGQSATVSFWMRANTSTSGQFALEQNFGSGGSATVLAINFEPFTVTTEWQRFTFTTTMPSISGKTIGGNSYVNVRIRMTPTSGGNFDLWGVQLEAGSVATPFRRHAPSLQGELAACQRYYQKSYGQGVTVPTNASSGYVGFGRSSTPNNAFYGTVRFPVVMRAAPTVVTYSFTSSSTGVISDGSGTDQSANSGGPFGITDASFAVINTSGGTITTTNGAIIHYYATAEL